MERNKRPLSSSPELALGLVEDLGLDQVLDLIGAREPEERLCQDCGKNEVERYQIRDYRLSGERGGTSSHTPKVICRSCGKQTFVEDLPPFIGVKTPRHAVAHLLESLLAGYTIPQSARAAAISDSAARSILRAINRRAL